MIKIEERVPSKIPGTSSLFISFNYDKELVEKIKTLSPVFNFDKKTKEWEFPTTSLSTLLDNLAVIDDIDLRCLPDQIENKISYVFDEKQFKPNLFEHQKQGIEFGMSGHDNWLLLDQPGLGKTLTTICIAQEMKRLRGIKHCLVICGINSLKSNWKNEIIMHSELSCKILGEKISKNGIVSYGLIADRLEQLQKPIDEFFVILNIETLRSEEVVKELLSGKHNEFDMIIMDEIHVCASPTSQQAKGLLKLSKAKIKIGLTGSLLTNTPLSLYVPLKWIGVDKSTYTNFKYYYCIYGGLFNHDIVGLRNVNVLKDQLEHCSLRRTKDLLNLPPKTVINEYVDMNPKQYKFYNDVKRGVLDSVNKVELDTSCVLSMLTRLRQATACPSVLTDEDIVSAKVERAVDLTEQICSDGISKVVIFSTFKETVKKLEEALKDYHPLVCTGDTGEFLINKYKEEFQNDDIHKVVICTWQCMGTGHTLNRASTGIFIDTPWTSSDFIQAQDRLHRIGTKENVFIYNLICKYSVDERVAKIVSDKEAMSDYVVDGKMSSQLMTKLKEIILDLE